MFKAILISSLLVNFLLVLGRFTGFIREVFIANIFGVTSESDIVALLVTLPDFLVSVLAGGALSAALIPAFTKLSDKDSERLVVQASLLLFIFFSIFAFLLYLVSENFIYLLAPGFSEEKISHAAGFFEWVLISLPISVLSGVFVAFLHSKNRFLIASFSTPVFNLILLLGLTSLWLLNSTSLNIVVLSLVLASLSRLVMQASAIKLSSFSFCFDRCLITSTLIKRYLQAFMSGSIFLLFPVVARAFASLGGDGSIAIFTYSMKLIELPLIISATFISIVLFPRLAASYNEDLNLHKKLIKYGIQFMLALSVIVTFILVFLVEEYVSFVYGGGVDDQSLGIINQITKIGLFSIPFQCLNIFYTTLNNSRGDTKNPMYVNLFGLAIIFFTLQYGIGNVTAENVMWVVSGTYVLCFFFHLLLFSCSEFKLITVFSNKAFTLLFLLLPFVFIYLAPLIFYHGSGFLAAFLFAAFFAVMWSGFLIIAHSDIRKFIFRKLKRV